MMYRLTKSTNFLSLSQGVDGKQDTQEVPEHPEGDNHDAGEDKKSLSEANDQKEEDVAETA